MRLIDNGTVAVHGPRVENSPRVRVLFGGDGEPADVGMVQVTVPAGAGMPAHRHNGSDVILVPLTGSVRVTKGDETADVAVGSSLLILKDESVALANPHDEVAEVIVAAGPAAFVTTVSRWPLVEAAPDIPAPVG